ncbi:hypothetical protein ACFQ1E_01640 [Sphingomonas canadensis]|uniref:Conjugal transfer protein TrbE n=1 Tax=Sphingomonas canadensis TaxID=1219257 RepID=A0ABW3H4F1_9SPHN|nr:hypothetical protein [Sphingomonas canadensis]MCW3835056.1 hypothetical protein [Sphingomonas canadensis]
MSGALSADRQRAMLRTAMGPAIAAALSDPLVVEVMVNPDGALRLDRLGEGRTDTGVRLDPAQVERIIRLVASHARTEVHGGAPILSAELPPHGQGAGERFEGVLPPVALAPCFSIRKPAARIYGLFLDHPLFAQRIREWLKTLRKKNVAVLFATQSLADIAASTIAPAIIESCPQRILLPNDRAIEPQSRQAYERFGLNERQIELVSRATPKRHYYLQSARGNRLFELGLGPIALALCGASDPASQARIDAILGQHGAHDFAARFLESAGLDWAAPLLAGFPQPPSSPE